MAEALRIEDKRVLLKRLRLKKLRREAATRVAEKNRLRQNLIEDARKAGGEREAALVEREIGPKQKTFEEGGGLFIEPKEITLPSGKKRTIDVIKPKVIRTGLETGASILAEALVPAPGTGFLGKAAVKSLASGGGAALGSFLSEPFDPSADPPSEALRAGILGTVGDVVPRAGGKVLFGPSRTIKEGAEAVNLARLARGDRPLLAAQSTRSFGIDLAQTAGESSILAGGLIRKAEEEVGTTAQRAFRNFLEDIGPVGEREDAGKVIQSVIEDTVEAKRLAERSAASRLDDIAPIETQTVQVPELPRKAGFLAETKFTSKTVRVSGGVDISDAKKFINNEFLDPAKGSPPEGIAERLRSFVKRPDHISFEEAWKRAREFGSVGKGGTEVFKGEAKGAADKSFSIINQAISKAGKAQNKEGLTRWLEFKAMVKMNRREFNTKFMRSILTKEAPEDIYRTAIANAEATEIRIIRGVMKKVPGGGDKWRVIQSQFLEDAAQKNFRDGVVNGKGFRDSMSKPGAQAKLKEIYPDAGTQKRIRLFADELALSQSKPDSAAFGIAFRFGQLGALGPLFIDGLKGPASAILLAPAAMAFLMSSNVAHKLLVAGLKAPPGSGAAIRAGTKLTLLLLKNGLAEEIQDTQGPSQFKIRPL